MSWFLAQKRRGLARFTNGKRYELTIYFLSDFAIPAFLRTSIFVIPLVILVISSSPVLFELLYINIGIGGDATNKNYIVDSLYEVVNNVGDLLLLPIPFILMAVDIVTNNFFTNNFAVMTILYIFVLAIGLFILSSIVIIGMQLFGQLLVLGY